MKYSLTNRQDPTYLAKADEILVDYKDRRAIPEYLEKYPQAALTLEVRPVDMPIEIGDIKDYFVLSQGRFTLSIPVLEPDFIAALKEKDIPFMYAYPASSAYELEALNLLGVSQVRIEAPLFFDANAIKKSTAAARVIVNIAHEGYIPTTDGIVGSWIRPEDVSLYDDYIDLIEFRDIDKKKEQALYRIYSEQHAWPGPLNMLITNIGTSDKIVNRMLPEEFTQRRLKCQQRCMSNGSCRLCWRYINLANSDMIKIYIEETQKEIDLSEQ